ncbi:MAG: T9SS type A sorting domain-containing protein [Ignavibacteria bacterium]|nr:T9SS type A sorting domain-containing protein [Ignavibacteria bacterium]
MKAKQIINYFCAIALILLLSKSAFSQVSFSAATSFSSTGNSAYGVVCADFNGDGKIDYATGNVLANTLSVFVNTTTTGASTPTFAGPTNITAGNNSYRLATADFNNDGKPDIAFGNNTVGVVTVVLNTTTTGSNTITFSAGVNFTTSNSPYGITTADINGDGKIDIVGTSYSLGKATVLINTTTPGAATPTFAAAVLFTTGNNPLDVCCADINLDGKPDIITGNGGASTFSVLLNTTPTGNATPTFSAKTDFTAANTSTTVTFADINLDGKPDIITGNFIAGIIAVNLNTTTVGAATPTFSAKIEFSASFAVYFLRIADINGDGKPDIISGADSKISVFLDTTSSGSATPNLHTRFDINTSTQVQDLAIADFNGDGKKDLIAAGDAATNNVAVFMNTMTLGATPFTNSARTDFSTNAGPAGIIPIDINSDGLQDIVWGNSNASNITIRLNNTTPGASTQSFTAGTDFATPIQPFRLCSGDFNLDGKTDFAFTTFGQTMNIMLNTTTPGASTPTLSSNTVLTASNSGVAGICSADFNLDGKPDLASSVGSSSTIAVALNTTTPGASTPTFSAITEFASGLTSWGICSADFNGDGKPDIACTNQNGPSISVYFNTTAPNASTPSFTAKTDFTTATSPNMIVAVDINGDGKPDLACSCQSSGGFVSVLLNTTTPGSSTPSFSAKTDFSSGTNCYGVISGDFTGDGKQDLASVNFGAATLSVFQNTTTAGATTPTFATKIDLATGSSPRGMCVADFNSDGKKDLVCSNLLGGNFSVFLNTTPIPLPVELSSFTSVVKGNDVTLNWSTVQEENNKGFEIERNSFGEGWKKIGYVEGNGTTNHSQNYSFTERGLTTGSYNYRLKQIDYNGNFEYHELTSEVIIGVPSKFSLAQNYPNPFNPSTAISFQLPVTGFVSLKVYDISGREVSSLINEVKDAGYYSVQFDAKSLSSGTYFYKLTEAEFTQTKKMILIK